MTVNLICVSVSAATVFAIVKPKAKCTPNVVVTLQSQRQGREHTNDVENKSRYPENNTSQILAREEYWQKLFQKTTQHACFWREQNKGSRPFNYQ